LSESKDIRLSEQLSRQGRRLLPDPATALSDGLTATEAAGLEALCEGARSADVAERKLAAGLTIGLAD
jgi:hypothetical protein